MNAAFFKQNKRDNTTEKFTWMPMFKSIMFSLRLIGLWPKNLSYKVNIYTLYALIAVSLFIFANTLCQLANLFMAAEDLDSFAASLFVASYIMTSIKIFSYINNMNIIKRLMLQINNQCFVPDTDKQRKVVTEVVKTWQILYKIWACGVYVFSFIWLSKPFMDGSYKNRDLPIFSWYPFDVKKTSLYQIAYLYQILGLAYVATANVNLDSFSVTLIVFIGVQCDILCENLVRAENLYDLVRSIKHHKEILRFAEDFNAFVGNLILQQFFTSAESLALGFFKLSLAVPGTSEFYTLVLFCPVIISEIFLYCWFGNEVELKSEQIPVAALKSKWIGNSKAFQKTMIIFLIRTQKKVSITAFNLFNLSLQTFMTIMRSSWSYFAVLRQMNVRQ